jgi:hypothetical protein
MIRKLKSGGYRLYSRKTDPRDRAGDAISVPSRPEPQPRSMSTTCSISSATEADPAFRALRRKPRARMLLLLTG